MNSILLHSKLELFLFAITSQFMSLECLSIQAKMRSQKTKKLEEYFNNSFLSKDIMKLQQHLGKDRFVNSSLIFFKG